MSARVPTNNFYRTQVYLGSDLWVRVSLSESLTPRPFADFTDVTLADEDTNSILADNDIRAIQDNVAMQVAPPDVKMLNQYKWRHLVTKFGSNAVAPPGSYIL